jgi:hypothetical protein
MPLPTLPPALKHALLAAGYKLDDEFSESLGILAVDAAVAVARAAGNLGGKEPAASRVGRNDPCPCGSGKKHKKCCLGKEPAAPAAPEAAGPTPLETPELIPCLDGPDGWIEGSERLEALLLDDPELQAIRFDELAVHEFLFEHGDEIEAAHASDDPDAVQVLMEGLATRYARTVDRMVSLKRVARALKEAAPRYRTDVAALRGLATGLAFAELPADDEDLPLASALFRLASFQPALDMETVQKVVAPENDDAADLLGTAGSHLLALSREAVQPNAEASAALERLIARAERFEAALEAMIADERFPVAVPNCVWVLMRRQASKKLAEGDAGEPGPEQAEAEEDWLWTAAEAYGQILGAWLEGNPGGSLAVRGLVRWLASQLVDHGFSRVSLKLLERAIARGWTSFLPGEAELVAARGGIDPLLEPSGEALSAYVTFLAEAGFGDLAKLIQAPENAASPS